MREEAVGRTVSVQGVEVPRFLYGTAWKEERTEELVLAALAAGFTGIDTANQRRHYHEAGVGAALRRARASAADHRRPFLQTKFTYVESQDHRLPYDQGADDATQVRQSLASSLEHLGVERLDSLLLHGPRARRGLSPSDHAVWRTMEALHVEGAVRLIGVSNVTAAQLVELTDLAAVPPAFVQNRCFARTGWDRDVRAVCRDRGVAYQGFSLLTANRSELARPEVARIARRHECGIAAVVFGFALQIGMIPLTGTTDPAHMRADLGAFELELDAAEVRALERIAG